MKNLIAELLVKLAEKEEESLDTDRRLTSLELVVTALLARLSPDDFAEFTLGIENEVAFIDASDNKDILQCYVQQLLQKKM